MEYIRCSKGHFYNPNEHSSCPDCAKGQNGGIMDFSTTMPVDSIATQIGITAGATSTLDHLSASDTADQGAQFFVRSRSEVQSFGSRMEDITHTMPISPGGTTASAGVVGSTQPIYPSSANSDPVVGWLVCVDGRCKGFDYKIHGGYNYIGRAKDMDICIPFDETVTAERAAEIAYDDQKNKFFFNKCNGRNIVRVNGDMVMVPVELKAYDSLTVGKTTLLFIPLCGEQFNWNDK